MLSLLGAKGRGGGASGGRVARASRLCSLFCVLQWKFEGTVDVFEVEKIGKD